MFSLKVSGLSLLLAVCCASQSSAQRQANVWYFGYYIGIDFNSGEPRLLPPSQMWSNEGSASIADRKTGELLFYTDGMTVWNREHRVMENGEGLLGHESSTQSALIVPDPGDSLRYYLFTVSAQHGEVQRHSGDWINYSLVDMRLGDGLGALLEKNIPLFSDTATEKLAATQHANGRDFWIVAHEWNSDRFFAWLLTPNGIEDTVTSATGSVHVRGRGHLKISPNGKLLAVAVSSAGLVELFDVDTYTGRVSNPRQIISPEANLYIYGLSFSPRSCKLYMGGGSGSDTIPNTILQYDVSSGELDKILASRKVINRWPSIGIRGAGSSAYQIGPDGKIYVRIYYDTGPSWLGSITYPDADGLACGYNHQAFYLGDEHYGGSGLPNMIDSWFARQGGCPPPQLTEDTIICAGSIARFQAPWHERPDVTIQWSFPGGSPPASNDTIVDVLYNEAGTFPVRITWHDPFNGYDTVSGEIQVLPLPGAAARTDTGLCPGDSIQLGLPGNPKGYTYTWSPAEGLNDSTLPSPRAMPSSSRTWTMEAVDSVTGCIVRDTVTISVLPLPQPGALRDTIICKGDSARLNAFGFHPGIGHSFVWSPSEDLDCDTCFSVVAWPQKSTTYYFEITNEFGCSVLDSVEVNVIGTEFTGAGRDTGLCLGESIQLGLPQNPTEKVGYTWSPAEGLDDSTLASPRAMPSQTTTYRLRVVDSVTKCEALDSVTVTVHKVPVADAGQDREICAGDSVFIGAEGEGRDGLTYSWFPTEGLDDSTLASPRAMPGKTITYQLQVVDSVTKCEALDSVTVTVHKVPVADAGQDREICAGDSVFIGAEGEGRDGLTYSWFPTEGLDDSTLASPRAMPGKTITYQLQVVDSVTKCEALDSVTVTVHKAQRIHTWIDRDFQAYTDVPIVIPVEVDRIPPGSGIDLIRLRLGFDPEIMRIDPHSIEGLLDGRLLEGWRPFVEEVSPGSLQLRLEAPAGRELSGSGELLGFEARLYLASREGTELKFSLESESDTSCLDFVASPGYAALDTICGLSFRLIEFGSARYSPLRVLPNPSGSLVHIEFGLGLDGETGLRVFDVSGKAVAMLLEEYLSAGVYRLEWDASLYGSGVYWLSLWRGESTEVRKVVLE